MSSCGALPVLDVAILEQIFPGAESEQLVRVLVALCEVYALLRPALLYRTMRTLKIGDWIPDHDYAN